MEEFPDVLPVLTFDNGAIHRIKPVEWIIRDAVGRLHAVVHQIPLMLGYASTVHKAQGMTLKRVQADLGAAFDCGQVYIALSRVSSIEGLRLTSFDRRKVMGNETVVEFEREVQRKKNASALTSPPSNG